MTNHHLTKLSNEDLDLISDLVLASGSLKDLAEVYSVSYPTIRLRLDKVIERLQQVRENKVPDKLTLLLSDLVERGELSASSARSIRETARNLEKLSQNHKEISNDFGNASI